MIVLNGTYKMINVIEVHKTEVYNKMNVIKLVKMKLNWTYVYTLKDDNCTRLGSKAY